MAHSNKFRPTVYMHALALVVSVPRRYVGPLIAAFHSMQQYKTLSFALLRLVYHKACVWAGARPYRT